MSIQAKIQEAIKGNQDLMELFDMAVEASQGRGDEELLSLLLADEDECDMDALELSAIAQRIAYPE